MRFLAEGYIFIGTIFLIALLFQSRLSVFKKMFIMFTFAATVILLEIWINDPEWYRLMIWKLKTPPNR